MKQWLIVLALLLATPLHAEEARVPNWAVINKICPPRHKPCPVDNLQCGHCLIRQPELYKDSDPERYRRLTKPAPPSHRD